MITAVSTTASQAGPSCEYIDNAHYVHMRHDATGGGDISWIHVKNAWQRRHAMSSQLFQKQAPHEIMAEV